MFKWLIFYFLYLLGQMTSHAVEERKFFTSGSLLYFQAEEGGLAYAVENELGDPFSSYSSIKNPEFEWDFGFKVGLGYHIPHDRWECLLQFTSLQTHCDAKIWATQGSVLFPAWKKPSMAKALFADQAEAHWRLHLGLMDLCLSKMLFTSKRFFWTPQIGLSTGWIRQKMHIQYQGGSFLSGEEERISMKNKYWGMGPKAGLSLDYVLFGDLNLFVKGSVSLLFGEFYLHQNERVIKTHQNHLGIHSIFPGSAPMIDYALGISWHHIFSKNLYQITFLLGWSQFLFFSQNQLMRFTSKNENGLFITNQGNLSMSGIEFNVRFDF